MKPIVTLIIYLLVNAGAAYAQTIVPTAAPYIHATLASGQQSRFDYIVSAGQVQIANVLLMLLVSLWVMFLFLVLYWALNRQRK